ncbi:MAG: COG4315 family predicted lipoprotein [Candidatus Limnocylindria bacterium]
MILPRSLPARFPRSAVALAIAGLALAACTAPGGSPSAQPSTTAASDPGMASESEAASASPQPSEAAAPATVTLVATDLGELLADGTGATLYLFTSDSAGTSTCYDDCAASWPPLTVEAGEEPAAAEGVSAQLGTTERTDGAVQVTVNGMPAYRYAGDAAPGEVNGQGVGGAWFGMGPDGGMVDGSSSAEGDYYDGY